LPREDKKEQILKAAEEMIRNRRFHEVTLDEVAQAAHVGKGTIYRYFQDKDDLFFQLATHGHDALCETILASADAMAPIRFSERLIAMCTTLSEFFLGRHALFRVMGEHEWRLKSLQVKNRTAFEEHRGRLRAAVAKVLGRGVGTAEVRTDIPLEVQAQLLMGMMRARNLWYENDPEHRPPVEQGVDLFLAGARPRSPQTGGTP